MGCLIVANCTELSCSTDPQYSLRPTVSKTKQLIFVEPFPCKNEMLPGAPVSPSTCCTACPQALGAINVPVLLSFCLFPLAVIEALDECRTSGHRGFCNLDAGTTDIVLDISFATAGRLVQTCRWLRRREAKTPRGISVANLG